MSTLLGAFFRRRVERRRVRFGAGEGSLTIRNSTAACSGSRQQVAEVRLQSSLLEALPYWTTKTELSRFLLLHGWLLDVLLPSGDVLRQLGNLEFSPEGRRSREPCCLEVNSEVGNFSKICTLWLCMNKTRNCATPMSQPTEHKVLKAAKRTCITIRGEMRLVDRRN